MTPAELRRHLVEELLPLWQEHGVDRARGGFVNRLDAKLRPAPDDFKRLLVHARLLYVFSRAWLAGAPPWALETAGETYAFLCDRFRDPRHGGWYLTTSLAGEPLDPRKDTYAHAFVVFALAHYGLAAREPRSLGLAAETYDLLERHLADRERGGFFEGADRDWTPTPGPRRQNPHMHLLEALLALGEATGERRHLDAALALLDLLRARFVDPARGCLLEHFTARWEPDPERGRCLEPGHHFEWTALLHQLAGTAARPDALGDADRLFRFGARHGIDALHGGVYDEIDPGGAVTRDTKRLWPQLEHLRALAARRAPELPAALELVVARYLDPATGAWREHCTRQGEVFSAFTNATSVYHLWTALTAAATALEPPA